MAKIAIITGSAGNLGQAVVKKFIENDYKVIGTVTGNNNVTAGYSDDVFEKQVIDLANEEAAAAFVNSVIAKYKTIDAAVLTVGGFAMGKIADTGIADIREQYKLNFETAYNIARPVFAQMMKQKNGRIFIVGSKPGLDARNGKGMIAYGLAKSLNFRLAELMNAEAKGHNVVTSVIVPSTIDTPQNREAMPDADFGNWVKAEEIADTIYFYCSDTAKAVREPVIKVYGNS